MLDAEPSRTALATAFVRALHVTIDERPPLLDDTLAFALLPGYQRRFITRLGALASPWQRRYRQKNSAFTSLRTQVVLRARYAEDALARAKTDGASRYVVLAAGLDTYAWRQGAPAIEVLEIDHPATQRWKRELLARGDLAEPDGVKFVAVDFEHETLADRWLAHDAPEFISWLGASYYLTREAISNTLKLIADRSRPGTGLVLDYWREAPAVDAASVLLWSARVAVALLQEPMRSFFEPEEIETLALDAGWRVRENCTPAEQERRYLASRNDRLSVPSFAYLLHLER